MEALITKIDSQFKEIKGEMKKTRYRCNSCGGHHPSSECDNKPMGGPKKEANYIYEGYRGGGYRGNYYGRNSINWRDCQPRDDNRHSQPREDNNPTPPTPEKKFNDIDFEKTMSEFCTAQGMPNYGKFLKCLVSNKSKMKKISTTFLNKECTAIIQNKLPPNLEGIVLGHKVSNTGLEVDKAKINVIAKLPPPTNVKAVRSFLRHVGFYRRFIKDFSKISRLMTKLLEKNLVFDFNEECIKAFKMLKEKLMHAPIMVSPD
ncbi:hypothetical protein Tco_0990106 [Tanacetum coccineum]|uniref:Reverse transcriptase domain-containing protein n=1 Tax=Tanacetum coccineum TaxID=301880 RepID=A0ABQ5EVZ0_9ASTR